MEAKCCDLSVQAMFCSSPDLNYTMKTSKQNERFSFGLNKQRLQSRMTFFFILPEKLKLSFAFFCLFWYFWFGEKIKKHWCAPVHSCYFLPFRSHSLCSRLRGLCHGNWQGSSNLGKQWGKQIFFSLWFLGSLSGRHTILGCVTSQATAFSLKKPTFFIPIFAM